MEDVEGKGNGDAVILSALNRVVRVYDSVKEKEGKNGDEMKSADVEEALLIAEELIDMQKLLLKLKKAGEDPQCDAERSERVSAIIAIEETLEEAGEALWRVD